MDRNEGKSPRRAKGPDGLARIGGKPRVANRRNATKMVSAGNDAFRHLDPVHGGGGDAPGVARPLAAGVETGEGGGLVRAVPQDAHGGGRAGLHPGEHPVRVGEAAELAVK